MGKENKKERVRRKKKGQKIAFYSRHFLLFFYFHGIFVYCNLL